MEMKKKIWFGVRFVLVIALAGTLISACGDKDKADDAGNKAEAFIARASETKGDKPGGESDPGAKNSDSGMEVSSEDHDEEKLSEDAMQLIEDFEGDWFGMVRINHAHDGYSKHADVEMYATARFSFDEKGDVKVYLCASVNPLISNFHNVTAQAMPEMDRVVVNFDFFEGSTKDDVYLRIDKGLLNGVADIVNSNGDEMDISLALRRIGDTWTEDETNVYWSYAAKFANLAVGENAESLAAAWCPEYPTPVPPLSNIAGGTTSADSGSGNAQADAGDGGDSAQTQSGSAGGGTGADFDADKRPSKLNGALIWDPEDMEGEGVSDIDTLAYAYRDAGSYSWYYEDWVAFIGTKGEVSSVQEMDFGTFYHVRWYTQEGEYLDVAFELTDEGFMKWNNTNASDGVYARYKEIK